LRNALAVVFVLIGAVLTVPASLAFWEQRVLTDRDGFVELGQDVFEKPAVQQQIASRIVADTEEIAAANGYSIPSGPAGNFARLQIETLTRSIVAQLPQSPIGETALVAAHEAVVTVIDDDNERLTSSGDEVRVNFRPVVEEVLGTLQSTIPGFPRVTLPQGTGEFVIVQKEDAALAFRTVRFLDGIAWYIAALPVAAFVVALVIASNRVVMLLLAGLATVLAAGAQIAFLQGPFRDSLIDNAVDDPALRPAALGIYDAVADSLIAQEMLLFVGGIFVIVFAIVLLALKRTGVLNMFSV
jgi:hypothetical protein